MNQSRVERISPEEAAAGWRNWIDTQQTLSPDCKEAVQASARILASISGTMISAHPDLKDDLVRMIKPYVEELSPVVGYMAARSVTEMLNAMALPRAQAHRCALVESAALISNAFECEIRKLFRRQLPSSNCWREVAIGIGLNMNALLQGPRDHDAIIRLVDESLAQEVDRHVTAR